MLELEFSAQDVAYTRLAFSPLWELVASVRVLKDPAGHRLHRSWVEQVRPRLASSNTDFGLLSELVPVPTRGIPAFIAPPPTTTSPDLSTELAGLRAVPAEEVRASLALMDAPLSPRLSEMYEHPRDGLNRLVDVIETYWESTLAPYWPRIKALCEDDVLYRARRLADGGAERLFDDLATGVSWKAGRLRVAHRHVSRSTTPRGRGLLLTPSVFIWPRVFSVTSGSWQPTLRYPPRGVGTLWEQRRRAAPDALAAVLGRTRAMLLAELATPTSTSTLAAQTGLTPGGVSQHLTALRAAGLVSAHRTGRFVLYARTDVAESLLASAT